MWLGAERLESPISDQQAAGSNPGRSAAECNPGQVVYKRVRLSICWFTVGIRQPWKR